jgi:hypothetical protein
METKFEFIYQVVGKIFFLFTLIVILCGLIRFKALNYSLKIFLTYLFLTFIYNGIEQLFLWSVNAHTEKWLPILNKFKITDTNFLALYGRLIDIAILAPFYIFILEFKRKKMWILGAICLFIFCIVIAIYVDGWRNYGTINSLINRSLLILLPLTYLWKLIKKTQQLSFWKNPYFLISLGILIPNLFSIIMSFIGNKLASTDYVLFIKVSLFRLFVSFFGQLLFIRAFLYAKLAKFLT